MLQLLVFWAGALLLGGAMRWWRGLAWTAILAYLGLVLVFFAAPLAGGAVQVPVDLAYQWRPWSESVPGGGDLAVRNGLLSDIPLQMLPFRTLVRQRWSRLDLPFWTGEIGTGEPLLGNAQSAPFAPLHLLALPLPPLRALTVAAAWQILLALLLTHALLAHLGTRPPGRALAAIAFAFSPFEVVWAYYPLGMTTAFLPGIVLGILLLREGERRAFAGTVACGLGTLLAGHPETAVQLGAACAALVAVLLLAGPARRAAAAGAEAGGTEPAGPRRPAAAPGRFALRVGVAAATMVCLAAPALLPALDALTASARFRAVGAFGRGERYDPRAVTAVLDPLRFGSPRDQNYTGPQGGAVSYNDVCGSYTGLIALAAALAGAALGVRLCRPLLAAGAFALAAALRAPPFDLLVDHLPGLDLAPGGRLRVVYVLAVAVAAGLAAGELPATRRGRLALAAALILGAGLLSLLPPPVSTWQTAWWACTMAGGAAAALALALAAPMAGAVTGAGAGAGRGAGAASPTRGGSAAAAMAAAAIGALLVVALLGDLWLFGMRYNPTLPAAFDLHPPAAIAALNTDSRDLRAPFRVLGELDDLKPNLGALYGLWDPRGNDPMLPAGAALVVGRALRHRYSTGQPSYLVLREQRPPLLDYLGVRYLLLRRQAHLPAPWRQVWDQPGQSLWRNDRAMELFFIPARTALAASDREALQRVLLNPDFRALAILRQPPAAVAATTAAASAAAAVSAALGAAGSAGSAVPGASGSDAVGVRGSATAGAASSAAVTRIQPTANGFDLDLTAATSALVASSVSYARGWHATAGRRDLPTCEVNAGFLAFAVPPGRHQIRLRYIPPHWPPALLPFCLGLVLCAAAPRYLAQGQT